MRIFVFVFIFCLRQLATAETEPNAFIPEFRLFSPRAIADVKAEAKAIGKPAMVVVTRKGSTACEKLILSINDSGRIREYVDKFVMVHADGADGDQWQWPGKRDTYTPRVYFLSPNGVMLDMRGPNKKNTFFYPSATFVERSMQTVAEDWELMEALEEPQVEYAKKRERAEEL